MKNGILIVILYVLVSCDNSINFKPEVKNSDSLINVEIENDKSNNKLVDIALDEYVKQIEYVVLETTPDNIISEVSKIFFNDDIMIIFDYKSDQIFIFDGNGNYKNKITKRGRAEDEYLTIGRGLFDEKQQQIIVYDSEQYKVLFYDLEGNYLRKITKFSDGNIVRDLINLPNGDFLCYRGDNIVDEYKNYTGLWRVDVRGKFKESYLEYKVALPKIYNAYHSVFQSISTEGVLIIDILHSDLYVYDKNKVEKVINYDIKNNILEQSVGKKSFDRYNAKCNVCYNKGNYLFGIWNDKNGERFYIVYDMTDKTTTFIDQFTNKDMSTPLIMSYIIDNNTNNIFTLSVDIDYLKNELNKVDFNEEQKENMRKVISKVKDSDNMKANPIIEKIYI